MFDISEAAANAYNWAVGKVRGVDTTDVVLGGVNGEANIADTELTQRTRNLHNRLQTIEALLVADSDNVVNSLYDVIQAFDGIPEGTQKVLQLLALKAAKDAGNLSAGDVTAWLTVLNIYTKSEVDTTNSAQNAAIALKANADGSGINGIATWRQTLGIGGKITLVASFPSSPINMVGNTYRVFTVFIPTQSNVNYVVAGSLLSDNGALVDPNSMCSFVIQNKTVTSFELVIRNNAMLWGSPGAVSNMYFNYIIIEY